MIRSIKNKNSARLPILAVALLAAVFWVTPSQAWNANGHKASTEIAFGLLTPEQQESIDRILRTHPRFQEDFVKYMPDGLADSSESVQALWIFQQASIWPDILRGLEEKEQQKFGPANWHYINMPVYLDDSDEKALDGSLAHNMSTEFNPPLADNLNIIQALKGNLQVWQDDDSTDSEKAVALCWIFHLVGDMHQPLHTVAFFDRSRFREGDRGGNNIRVKWEPKDTNLHAVWDNLPDRFDNLEPGDLTKDWLRTDVVATTSIDYWLRRHTQLAKALVYTDEVRKQLRAGLASGGSLEIELSEFYLSSNTLVAKEQIILSGHRMAALLQ